MTLIILVLNVASAGAAGVAAWFWWASAKAPIPKVGGLAGLADPPGLLGRPLGGGTPVIISGGPINEIVAALEVQARLNRRGATAAAVAALLQAIQIAVSASVGGG